MKTKEIIREAIRKKLAAQKESERLHRSLSLHRDFYETEAFKRAASVLLYLSFDGEVDTWAIVRKCFELGKRVMVPRVKRGSGELELREILHPEGPFSQSAWGVMEPVDSHSRIADPGQVDCVLVPGIAFDRKGHRLGRGKGFYDRLLARLGPKVPRIALAFSFQIVDEIPREPHDQTVHSVLVS